MAHSDLLSSVHVFQRNPVGHSQRTRNVGPAMAPSPRSREVFGPLSIKALRIAFRWKNPLDMRKVTKRGTAWRSSYWQRVDRLVRGKPCGRVKCCPYRTLSEGSKHGGRSAAEQNDFGS